MEFYANPIKRTRMVDHRVNHSESNEPNLLLSPNGSRNTNLACLDEAQASFCSADISNAEAIVKQDDSFNDRKESLLEGSQVEHSGLEQESHESKNKIVMEGSKLTTNEDSSGKSFIADGAGENAEHDVEPKSSANVNVVCDVYMAEDKASVEASSRSHPIDKLCMSTESKMDAIHSLSKLDAIKGNASQVKDREDPPPQILSSLAETCHSHSRKKLLVLDVNGLLVDIVADPHEAYRADTIIGSKAVFKRPYCDEFLQFCFERFNVGVWTSRTRRNIERVLDFLIRDTQHQLLFCWDQSHCTNTGFNTIENSDKPLVLKELKRLWEKQDPNLPWDRGEYDESNTLLLDDSPYKALRNPPYTAIFPYTYCYRNSDDNGLGPEGDLRNYLEMLAASDNVQKFIEQNPFGQPPITNNSQSWRFYLKVISATSSEPEADATSFTAQPLLEVKTESGPSRSRKKLLVIDASGLLVDIASVPHEAYEADTIQGSKAVFKRPYCDEFLQFCFERFNVGVWTSTTRSNIERVLDFLMRDTQHKLLFCWDRTHCTDTGFSTVENWNKPLLLKELRRLWEKQDPNLPWDRGDYDESNTLLLEISPYKALLNPRYTAIFPYPYRRRNREDDFLGPKGDLRIYLERLAASENVQKFVEENPFGQRPITKKNLSWGYYSRILRAFSCEPEADTNSSLDAQCINSSEPGADTSTSVAQALSEPEAGPATTLAVQALSEPEADPTTTSAAQALSEPEADPTTTSVAQASSEREADTTTTSAAHTLLKLSVAITNPSLEPVNGGSSGK